MAARSRTAHRPRTAPDRPGQMTAEELLRLPAVVGLTTAGNALGVGRTRAHEMARAGEFPVPVLRLGNAYKVPTAPLLALLGITRDTTAGRAAPDTSDGAA